ncbi:MAG TPA: adenylate/guanylate cyclase domain-containing protein [Terriglobales bacterium]|nr:adenylate/guanylate cyclase domain-containing protein [Terriglobales bacterium]
MPCPECGTPTAPGAHFCHNCGKRLESAADGLKVGDRRVVTALFADLVGYTKLVDELDPEEVRARVDGALTILGHAVSHFGGSLEKFIGDAVMVVFGTPVAHDDDALRACLCALEMQSSLSRYVTGGQPMELRVGIATGEVVAALRDVAGNRSVALTGDPMTTAARLQQLAEPNEILLDEATAAGGEPRIGVDRLGERLLRGQRRPVPVALLRGERRVVNHAPRRAVPLVGRDAEKARLAEVIRRTGATGKGGAVLLRGEPGIGKSRLLCEMEEEAKAAGLAWLWIDNAPHSMESPYRTVRNMVDWLADEQGTKAGIVARQLLFGDGVPENLDPEIYRLMLGAIAVLARDSEMTLRPEEGWESGLLALADSADFQLGLTLATQLWVSRLVSGKPRCIVVDDYHWVDPSSRQLVDMMISMAGDLPLVVLTGSRPPATPAWIELSHVEVIDLVGLDESATEKLGAAVAGSALEFESGRWLHQRTAGNALFVGEIIRTLRDTGRLEQIGDLCRIDRGAARRGVPLSLRALLGARIDALPPAQRNALEVAAVIGSSFSEPLLTALCDGNCSASELGELTEAGILTVVDDPGQTEKQWKFRHQLYLDAAYGRPLADRRRLLHATLADLLEATQTRPDLAELARHRIAAGDSVRAQPLLEQAAREAASAGAIAEAEGFRRTLAELRGEAGTTVS